MFILLKGSLSVMATNEFGEPTEIHKLRSGDAFGYSDLLRIKVS